MNNDGASSAHSARCSAAARLAHLAVRLRSAARAAGIVIKYGNMEYKRAVHHTAVVLELCAKARMVIKNLFDSPDNDMESVRLKTSHYEMLISQAGNITLVAIQEPPHKEAEATAAAEGEEKKEG